MIIEPGTIKRVVEEYDIVMKHVPPLTLTIDEAAGDTITFEKDPVAVKIVLVAKPSPNNPDIMVPAEDYTIHADEIAYIRHRTIELTQYTPNQQAEYKAIFKTHPTIQ